MENGNGSCGWRFMTNRPDIPVAVQSWGKVFFPTSRAAHHGGNSLVWLQKISHRVIAEIVGPISGVRGLPVVEAIAIYSDAGARWCLFRMFM
jgi:hypothetical protein